MRGSNLRRRVPVDNLHGVSPELSGVGEQEMQARIEEMRNTRPQNTHALLQHHRQRLNRTLGELPESLQRERMPGPQVSPPPANVGDWVNTYTGTNFPFVVGLTSLQILPANPLRTYLLIQNKSAGNMYVNFGSDATVFSGIQIITIGNYEFIGGAHGGAYCPSDGVYILGDAVSLEGVVHEGVVLPLTEGRI